MELLDFSGLWIVAAGKTLIHSLWVGFLILALLRIMLVQIPVKFAGLRYGISVTAMFLLLSSVIGIFVFSYRTFSSMGDLSYPIGLVPREDANISLKNISFAGIDIHRLLHLFGEIYIMGLLAMMFRSAASFRYVHRLRKSGIRIDPEWQQKFQEISKMLGVRCPVDFLESTRIKGPLLVGFLKPAVIIPAGMITHLPFSQIETILMHELYHLKRMDYLVNIMQLIVEGLLFYHPAIWILSDLIRKERENCCDARVLNKVGDPLNYAKALVHLAEKQQFSRLVPGTMGANRNHFKVRIYRILNRDAMKTNLRDRAASLALLAGSALILMVVNSFSAAPSFITSGKMLSEINTIPEDQSNGATVDTIPQFDRNNEKEEMLEEMDAIDWEKLKAEVEEARMNALEQIEEVDWEKLKAEVEEARMNALEQIEEVDWEKMKAEMEVARREALKEIKEIDWEKMKAEIEDARREALEEIKEIDWEKMKAEIEDARREVLEHIDEIDWDEIRNDIKKSRVFNDSVRNEIDQ